MAETVLLKDQLFNPSKVIFLAQRIKKVYPALQAKAFKAEIIDQFPKLELKERIAWIRQSLKKHLPQDYQSATKILLKALPPELAADKKDDDFGDFIFAPFSDYVAHYGCTPKDLSFSLAALKTITKRFSAEDAIRYFINAFPETTLAEMQTWTQDYHYHVRRLVSEGSRPKLPWAQKIKIKPQSAIPLLDPLFRDPTRYVTRSVANHLNDISKLDPDLVLDTLRRWQASKQQNPKEMDYIIRHALRTLIKKGHPEALVFLGYSPQPQLKIKAFKLTSQQLKIGQSLEFAFEIEAQKSEPVIVDYQIHFCAKNGKLNPKVFKLKNLKLVRGKTYSITKKHALKVMSTKKLYPGQHQLALQINGKDFGNQSFVLTE